MAQQQSTCVATYQKGALIYLLKFADILKRGILLLGGSDYQVAQEEEGQEVIYLTPEKEKKIKNLIGIMTCPSDFICYKSEFGDLKKKVKDTSLSDCLECIQGEQEFVISKSLMEGDTYVSVHLHYTQ